MKRPLVALLAAVIALSSVGSSAALAHNDGFRHAPHERGHDWRQDGRRDDRRPNMPPPARWERGHKVPPAYRVQRHAIPHPSRYHLRPAPRGHQWIRAGNDALLVVSRNGIIVDMRIGLFR